MDIFGNCRLEDLKTRAKLKFVEVLNDPLTRPNIYPYLGCLFLGYCLPLDVFLTAIAILGAISYHPGTYICQIHPIWSAIFKSFEWLDSQVAKGLEPQLYVQRNKGLLVLVDKNNRNTAFGDTDKLYASIRGYNGLPDIPIVQGDTRFTLTISPTIVAGSASIVNVFQKTFSSTEDLFLYYYDVKPTVSVTGLPGYKPNQPLTFVSYLL